MKAKKQEQCQGKKAESSCTKKIKQDKCMDKKEDNKKSSENKCDDNPDCTTCPVCYTFIFQPQYELPAQQFLFKKSYSLLTTGYISSYTPDVWKPPNGFLYSL